MNFEVYTNTRFRAGIDIFSRLYYPVKKSNGKIKIVSVIHGAILLDNIETESITISGRKMNNLEELESVLFNKNCVCDSSLNDEEMRIFDETFDKTFE